MSVTRWFSERMQGCTFTRWFKWWKWLCRILISLNWICRASHNHYMFEEHVLVAAWIGGSVEEYIRASIRSPGTLLLPWSGCDEESWSARFWKRQIHTKYISRETHGGIIGNKTLITVFQEEMMIRYKFLVNNHEIWLCSEIWMVSFNHTIRWLDRLFIYSFSFSVLVDGSTLTVTSGSAELRQPILWATNFITSWSEIGWAN